jgi:chemotaxis protein histidine kinase CheA
MQTLQDYFRSEAFGCLEGLERSLFAGAAASEDAYRQARRLRGLAQVAAAERVRRVARGVEALLRALAQVGEAVPEPLAAEFGVLLGDLRALVEADGDDASLDAIERAALARLDALEAPVPDATGVAGAVESAAETGFREFAAREVAGIEAALAGALGALSINPMDREVLRSVLRRQRVLLGAVRLDELPAVADTLRAVEDISRVIAKMNVAVKDEWYDVFRLARQVMESARDALAAGEEPPRLPALSRLRTYRAELLDRYGDGEAVALTTVAVGAERAGTTEPVNHGAGARPASLPEPDGSPAAGAGAPEPAPAAVEEPARSEADAGPGEWAPLSPDAPSSATDESVLDIQDLCYDGTAALRRALDLRARVERAVEHDPDALAAVDELFDLIRLALR